MHNFVKAYTFIFVLLVISINNAFSQVTQSPYSFFGLGNIDGNSIGVTKAMGGTGIAFLSEYSLNVNNPASYSGLDSLLAVYEIGVFGRYTKYETGNEKDQRLFNSNFRYIAMGFKVAPKVAISFGLLPYSSIGYKINELTNVTGSYEEYTKAYSGEGGVNKVYFGSSFKLNENFRLGINVDYLYGTVNRTESSDYYYYFNKEVTNLSNINADLGLNYQIKRDKWRYNIGFTYSPGRRLTSSATTTVTTPLEIETYKERSKKYSLPHAFGLGFAAQKEFFKVGVDYELKLWNDIDFYERFMRTRNSNRYSFGVEFASPDIWKGTSKMILYRLGAEYNQSYLVIRKTPINYRAVSFGAGIPLNGVLSVINVSFEIGQNGAVKNELVKETFCTLHLDMTFKDIWFIKRKYY